MHKAARTRRSYGTRDRKDAISLTNKATTDPMTIPARAPPDNPLREVLANPADAVELVELATADEEEGERAGRT